MILGTASKYTIIADPTSGETDSAVFLGHYKTVTWWFNNLWTGN